jgi:hypothetical protein
LRSEAQQVLEPFDFTGLDADASLSRRTALQEMDVAGALIAVRPLYRCGVDPDSLLEAKCWSQPLVPVRGRGRREVYWQGLQFDVDWSIHQAPWDLLATLAERAYSLQGADAFDLEGGRRSRLKDRRHRLIRFLPASLNEKIHPAGRGTYKLALRPEEICLLRYAEDERLAELPTGQTQTRPCQPNTPESEAVVASRSWRQRLRLLPKLKIRAICVIIT